MHPALTIPELIRWIFACIEDLDDLDSYTATRRKNKALARLARTCKSFKRPAIDELWADVNAYVIYKHLIPHRLIMREHGDPDPYGWSATSRRTTSWIADVESLSLSDRETILEYTTSIRILRFPSVFTIPIASPALRALESLPGGVESTFPKLDSVFVVDWLEGGVLQDYLPFVTHAGSLGLKFSNQGLTNKSVDFLTKSMSRRHPPVHSLDLDFTPFLSRELLPTLSRNILRLNRLHTLVCTELDQTALLHLSRLPTLTSLEFMNILDLPSTPDLSFPNLDSLTMKLPDFSDMLFFVDKLARFPSSIKVHSWTKTMVKDSKTFFSVLVTRPDTKIRQITQAYMGGITEDKHLSLTLDTIRPLLTFTSLRVFVWKSPTGVHITNKDLGMMAQAWPRIEQLRIVSNTKDYIPFASLDGVFSLAKLCPHLEDLALPVDASKLAHVPLDSPADGLRHRRMKALDLGASYVDARGQAKLAIIIAQVFPCVESVVIDMRNRDIPRGPVIAVGV